jgi:hypothetical protein
MTDLARVFQDDKWSIGIICRIAALTWLIAMILVPHLSDRPYMVPLFHFRYVALACAVIGAVLTRRRWVSFVFAVMACVVFTIAVIRPR